MNETIDEVLRDEEELVADYVSGKSGKDAVVDVLLERCMRALKGKANPAVLAAALEERLRAIKSWRSSGPDEVKPSELKGKRSGADRLDELYAKDKVKFAEQCALGMIMTMIDVNSADMEMELDVESKITEEFFGRYRVRIDKIEKDQKKEG